MKPAPDGDVTPIVTPPPVQAALGITGVATLVLGVLPGLVLRLRRPRRPHRCLRPLTSSSDADASLAARAAPLRRVHELALYGEHGFYTTGGRPAGAATSSPRPRSGRCSARCSPAASMPSGDGLGDPTRSRSSRPAPGRARWPAVVLAAAPACRGALRYVAVEVVGARSAAAHPDGVESRGRPARRAVDGVVVANELLDNLPFRLLVFDGGWREAYVAVADGERSVEVLSAPLDPVPAVLPRHAPHGARAPLQRGRRGVGRRRRAGLVRSGSVLVARLHPTPTAELAGRPWREWLRTYRGHERGGHYLADPGDQDITTEVRARPAARRPTRCATQAEFLRSTASTSSSTRATGAWRPQRSRARPGGDDDAQPRSRGRGPARPDRPRRLHRPRVADLTTTR